MNFAENLNSEVKDSLPLVSIGIPTYNRPEGLRAAVQSALDQTYGNIEIIIADNCSPDPQVEEICNELATSAKRVRYYRHPKNFGPAVNFRFVLEEASGDYFMWLCDDDALSKNYVECCVKKLADPSIVLCAGQPDLAGQRNDSISTTQNSPYIRVLKFLLSVRMNSVIFGLHRMKAVQNMDFVHGWGGDWCWVADLAFQGKVLTTKDATLFRKFRGSGSSQQYARTNGLPLYQMLFPYFFIAHGYCVHILRGDFPYDTLSKLKKISLVISSFFVLQLHFFIDLKSSLLHALKRIMPNRIVRFLNFLRGKE